jgi:hypothetical protein
MKTRSSGLKVVSHRYANLNYILRALHSEDELCKQTYVRTRAAVSQNIVAWRSNAPCD